MLFYCIFSLWICANRRQPIVPFMAACFTVLFLLSSVLPEGSGIRYLLSNTLIVEFLFGVGLAKIFLQIYERTGPQRTPPWASIGLIALGCTLLFGTTLIHTTDEILLSSQWRFVFWGVPSGLIVLGFASCNRGLTNPAMVYLGDASYSTYLAHAFFVRGFGIAIERSSELRSVPADAEIAVATLITVLLTLLAYRWLEQPLTALFQPALQAPTS
jgi:peptidoglycan/LPS O-acetylase OafA/YrhL